MRSPERSTDVTSRFSVTPVAANDELHGFVTNLIRTFYGHGSCNQDGHWFVQDRRTNLIWMAWQPAIPESTMYTLRVIRPSSPWRELHRLQGITAMLLLMFAPIGWMATHTWGEAVLFPFAAVVGGLLLFFEDRAINWKCPRCAQPFLRNKGKGFALPFRRACGNCGLRNGASDREINQ